MLPFNTGVRVLMPFAIAWLDFGKYGYFVSEAERGQVYDRKSGPRTLEKVCTGSQPHGLHVNAGANNAFTAPTTTAP